MQVLVTYFSRTGHTKQLAEAIAQGVSDVDQVRCLRKPISEVTKEDFTNSDGIIVGSPVYFGGMAAEVKALLDSFVGVRPKMADKIGAAFATSGDLSGGKETTMISLLQALLIYGMIVVGDPMDATGHYGVSCVGEPDAATRVNGTKLGKRVATLVKKLKG
jgi:NAD(P)H dehydrogenase (quinone)